jgi:transcriptional regulator with XRE-family HTH domain
MATITTGSLRQKLKHYRRLKNFSQETLAHSSGISIRTIQRIEDGTSIGSAYTLDKLATSLGINVSILTEQTTADPGSTVSREKLNLLNLSALTVILVPLANIILPALILSRNKHNAEVIQSGQRILNFQILWTLSTIVLIIVIPGLLLLIKPFRGSSIPLTIPAYYLCVAVNVFFTLKSSIAINNQQPFLNRIPKIL